VAEAVVDVLEIVEVDERMAKGRGSGSRVAGQALIDAAQEGPSRLASPVSRSLSSLLCMFLKLFARSPISSRRVTSEGRVEVAVADLAGSHGQFLEVAATTERTMKPIRMVISEASKASSTVRLKFSVTPDRKSLCGTATTMIQSSPAAS
jgi:hypothetical protein